MSNADHTPANAHPTMQTSVNSRGSSKDPRPELLRLIREKSLTPESKDILELSLLLKIEKLPLSVDGLKLTERKVEKLRLELEALCKDFWTLPTERRTTELNRLLEKSKAIPPYERYIRQLGSALALRNRNAKSQDGESMRIVASDWLLHSPSGLASERLRWFDKNIEENRKALVNLQKNNPELFQAIPNLSHYVLSASSSLDRPREIKKIPPQFKAPTISDEEHRNRVNSWIFYFLAMLAIGAAKIFFPSSERANNVQKNLKDNYKRIEDGDNASKNRK